MCYKGDFVPDLFIMSIKERSTLCTCRRESRLPNANVGLRHNLTVCPDGVAPGNVNLATLAHASLNMYCPRHSRTHFSLLLIAGVQVRHKLWKLCRVRMSNRFLPPINPQPAVIC